MDELAVAVATLAVSMDVDNEEEMGVEAIYGTVALLKCFTPFSRPKM